MTALGHADFSAADLASPPDQCSWGMAVRLLPHQAQALQWLGALAGRGLGGVLCDEPGTGKVRVPRVRA